MPENLIINFNLLKAGKQLELHAVISIFPIP